MQYLTKISMSPVEPIDLQSMFTYLKQDPDDGESDLVNSLITAARTWSEGYQRRSLVSEQWRLSLSSFPRARLMDGECLYEGYEALWQLPGTFYHPDAPRYAIELPRGPLITIDSFTYLDPSGVTQTITTNGYQIVTGDDVPPRIYPPDNAAWPVTKYDPQTVTLDFTAGFTADNIPAHTLTALKVMVAAFYEDRSGSNDIPPLAKRLLDLDRTPKV